MIFKSKKTRFVILFSYFMATSLVVFIKILSSSLTLQLLFILYQTTLFMVSKHILEEKVRSLQVIQNLLGMVKTTRSITNDSFEIRRK